MPDVNLKKMLFFPPVAKGKVHSNACSHKHRVHAVASLIHGVQESCNENIGQI